MKKLKNKRIIIVALVVVVVVIIALLLIIIINKRERKEDNSATYSTENNVQDSDLEELANSKTLSGTKGSTLDYYWNIDTTQFDKSKFNGNIYCYGSVVNGKITFNKLRKAGFSSTVNHLSRLNGKENLYYSSLPLYKNNNEIKTDTFGLRLMNYCGENSIYSDNTLVTTQTSFFWNLTQFNIYPNALGINDASDITVDLVLEKLGNPTYVDGRKSHDLKSEYTYTTYVYVYDDVAFLFAFYNWRSDLSLASAQYYPIEQLEIKDSEGKTAIDKLKNQYQMYINN